MSTDSNAHPFHWYRSTHTKRPLTSYLGIRSCSQLDTELTIPGPQILSKSPPPHFRSKSSRLAFPMKQSAVVDSVSVIKNHCPKSIHTSLCSLAGECIAGPLRHRPQNFFPLEICFCVTKRGDPAFLSSSAYSTNACCDLEPRVQKNTTARESLKEGNNIITIARILIRAQETSIQSPLRSCSFGSWSRHVISCAALGKAGDVASSRKVIPVLQMWGIFF